MSSGGPAEPCDPGTDCVNRGGRGGVAPFPSGAASPQQSLGAIREIRPKLLRSGPPSTQRLSDQEHEQKTQDTTPRPEPSRRPARRPDAARPRRRGRGDRAGSWSWPSRPSRSSAARPDPAAPAPLRRRLPADGRPPGGQPAGRDQADRRGPGRRQDRSAWSPSATPRPTTRRIDDLYPTVCVGSVLKMLKFPDGSTRIVCQGMFRARLDRDRPDRAVPGRPDRAAGGRGRGGGRARRPGPPRQPASSSGWSTRASRCPRSCRSPR